MTNCDRIRQMTDEELADWITDGHDLCDLCQFTTCRPEFNCERRLTKMPELIDREVTQLLLDTAIKQFGENWLQDKLTKNGLLIAKQIISKQPTIEAEPVRHGEWHESWYTDTICASICTNCGKATTQARTREDMTNVRYPLCPNCGARMDEGGITNAHQSKQNPNH